MSDEFSEYIDKRVEDLKDEFGEIDSDKFVGTNQWFIRCNGLSVWASCETQGTWFPDDDTMDSGPQSWDRSSYDQGDDESDEEFDARFAADSRPVFPEDAVRQRVEKRLIAALKQALDDSEIDW